MDERDLLKWAEENLEGEEFRCSKDQVYVLSCGTNTYTWFVKKGVLFTAMQTENSVNDLANSIWREGNMVHSLDDDTMLPFHPLTDCTLLRFKSADFNEKIRQDLDLSWYMVEYYHHQFTRTLDNYRHAALDSSENRLAYLEKLFSNIDELKDEKISDATMASFMGMHRVSVSRIRKKLERGKLKE